MNSPSLSARLGALALVLVLSPLAAADTPVYLISIATLETRNDQRVIDKFVHKTQRLLNKFGGEYVTGPITVEQSGTDAQDSFPGEYVLIARLPDQGALSRYSRAAGAEYIKWRKKAAREMRFVATAAAPGVTLEEGDKSLLLRAANLSSDQATGGVLAAFVKSRDLKGKYPFDALLLSKWNEQPAQSGASTQYVAARGSIN